MCQLKVSAGYYVLKPEAELVLSVKFLQLRVTLDADKSMARVAYEWKEDHGPPLSASSAHPPSIHTTWPGALTSSCLRLSSFRADGISACGQLDQLFSRYLIQQDVRVIKNKVHLFVMPVILYGSHSVTILVCMVSWARR